MREVENNAHSEVVVRTRCDEFDWMFQKISGTTLFELIRVIFTDLGLIFKNSRQAA